MAGQRGSNDQPGVGDQQNGDYQQNEVDTGSNDAPFEKANPYIAAIKAKAGLSAAIESAGSGRKLRKFVGYLDEADGTGTRRLYFTHELDSGVDIPESAIVYGARLPARRRDGLMRDYVVVRPRAALLFWSRRPMKRPDPQGGGIVGGPFP